MMYSKTDRFRKKLKQLREEQHTWRPHWQEISEYMMPMKGKYLLSESQDTYANDGAKKHQKIINGSANDALRIIAAGLQGGLTSPSRPWFALTMNDENLAEFQPVREWLHNVRSILMTIFSRSNFYGSIHSMYKELAAFGTGAMLIEEDFESVIRARPFTIGEYMTALDSKYRARTLYRQFAMTADQMIEAYGIEAVSDQIKSCYDNGNGEKRFEVVQAIEPNGLLNPYRKDFQGKQFISAHFELNNDPDKMLRLSGYNEMPFVVARWDVNGVDVYGTAPGMDALGDVKMLQKMEEKKLKALDKMVDPPMNAPSSMKGKGATVIAGGVNYLDALQGGQTFAPAYQVNPNMQQIGFEIERVEQRIKKFFFNDLFLSIIMNEKNMTATEVAKRYDEKMMVLGAVIERLQSEMLDPVIDRVFNIADRLNLLPPPPKEIEGLEIKVEYISLLAQAQKMVGTTAIEQTAAFVGNLAAVSPDVIDKFDFDEAVDQYAGMVGVPPKMIRSDDAVAEIRAQRAQAQAQAQMQEQIAQSVQGAKIMSETKVGNNSALDALLGVVDEGEV